MLDDLKKQVCQANLDLVARGLVVETFGNASGIDRPSGCVVIKPSGVTYEQLKPKQMVVVSCETALVVEGELRPSSDTPSHLVLYRAFPAVGGIVHTHSVYATAWAQARRDVPPLGTTHADYFPGPIPCTRPLTPEEIETDYEANTARAIVERFEQFDPSEVPGVLVASHGPFAWGRDVVEAVAHAGVVEHLARLACETLRIEPYPRVIAPELLAKHFARKHGAGRYYGQEG
jgi:L-ribulose-5-phosphate 4-epimerase